MTSPSLAIDLGAAFTKIAFRPRDDAPAHLLTHPDLNLDPNRFCIPSVAARDARSDRWVFGMEAMDLENRGPIEVFRDWKGCLFRPKEERPVDFATVEEAKSSVVEFLQFTYPYLRAREVAGRYLQWLHDEMVPEMLGHPLPEEIEVQLCVPDFVIRGDLGALCEGMMKDAGFRNRGFFTLSEPKANLVGILTGGRNAPGEDGRPNLAALLADPVTGEPISGDAALLFIDVGAYSADFALTRLQGLDGAGLGDEAAESVLLGMKLLDDLVLHRCDEATQDALREMPASGWERMHESLYGGEGQFAPAEAWAVEYGREVSREAVEASLEDYCGAVGRAALSFLNRHREGDVRGVVLTGGGNNLARLAGGLAAQLTSQGIPGVYLAEGAPSPESAVRHELSQEMIRGSSGIGAASILFAR